jgi:hypothetical protein
LEGLGKDGRIILKWILKKQKGMGWISAVQDRGTWRALVCTVMKFWVP